MVQTSISTNNTYSNFNPLMNKVISYKNIKPNINFIKNLPTHNYIKCFCPIHGDQPDNEKHKCLLNNENNHCISSLRYNCAHCNNENGRSLSHVAFQKHLRKFHSSLLEKMKIKDNIKETESFTQIITPMISINEISKKDNIIKDETLINYNKSVNSYFNSKKKNINIAKKENPIACHKIQINSFKINKNKNISITTANIRNTHSSPFISLQLICACELLIEKTLKVVFHESYLSYDIPTKLMVLKYALTGNKISCNDTIKKKMINCIENLENYFNIDIKMDSFELEKELRMFLQFLLNYTNN